MGEDDVREARGRFERPLPDLARMPDGELKDLMRQLAAEERALSYEHSIAAGHLKIVRAEWLGRIRQRPVHVEAELVADAMLRRWTRANLCG